MQFVSKHGHKTSWKTMLRVLPPTLKLVSQLQLGFCKLRESRLLIGELSAPLWAVPNKASLVDLLDVVFFFNQAHFLSQSSSLHFSIIIVDVFGLRDGVRIGDSDQDNGKCEPAAMQTLFRLKKHYRIVRESSMKGAQQPNDVPNTPGVWKWFLSMLWESFSLIWSCPKNLHLF